MRPLSWRKRPLKRGGKARPSNRGGARSRPRSRRFRAGVAALAVCALALGGLMLSSSPPPAQAQAAARSLTIEDGWTYFLRGWSDVIAEIFGLDIDAATFGQMRAAANLAK